MYYIISRCITPAVLYINAIWSFVLRARIFLLSISCNIIVSLRKLIARRKFAMKICCKNDPERLPFLPVNFVAHFNVQKLYLDSDENGISKAQRSYNYTKLVHVFCFFVNYLFNIQQCCMKTGLDAKSLLYKISSKV